MDKKQIAKAMFDLLDKDIHIFTKYNSFFAFSKESCLLFKLTENDYNALFLIKSDKNHTPEIVYKYLDDIETVELFMRIISHLDKRRVYHEKLQEIDSILLLLTDKCNLACSYCYCSHKHNITNSDMSKETGSELVEFIARMRIKSISFFGGEPLLNLQTMKVIINKSTQLNLDINYGITTNGTLITEAIAEYFKEKNITVSVSMDGPPYVNDLTRYYKDSKSCYEETKKGIELLKKNGVIDLIEMTYSTRHPQEIGKTIKEMQAFGIDISCTVVDGNEKSTYCDDIVKKDGLINYYTELLKFQHENRTQIFGTIELINNLNSDVCRQRDYICSGIMNRITISPSGHIYPCPEMIEPQYLIGSIYDINSKEELEMKRNEVMNKLLKGDKIKAYWFSNLIDNCIVRLSKDTSNNFDIHDADIISDTLESAIAYYSYLNEI